MAKDLSFPQAEDDSLSEDALVQQALQGKEEALTTLIQRHQSLVFGYLVRMTRDSTVAEDLFQQTWLNVIEALPRYRPSGRFKAWLMTIAHHACMSHFERRSRAATHTPPQPEETESWIDQLPDPGPLPDAFIEEDEQRAWTRSAMTGLPPDLLEVVLLRCDHDLSFKEIARIQGVSLNTALGRMHYAVQHLRARWRLTQSPSPIPNTINPVPGGYHS